MSNGYKSQQIDRGSISGILQLLQGLSSGNKPTQMESNVFKEFTTGAGSINNEDLNFNYNRMKEYYDKNVDSMSDDELQAYSLLDERYNEQQRKNTQFDIDIARKNEYTDSMTNFADEYIRMQDSNETDFTISKKQIIDGKMTNIEEVISLPNPNDYVNGTEDIEYRKLYNEKMKQYGGIDGYNQKKEEYLSSLNNDMQRTIGSFSDYMGSLISNYSGSGRLQNWHLNELQGLEDTYQFIVNSMEDNGLIDRNEKQAYQNALMQKSSDPIKQFVIKDKEMKDVARNTLYSEMDTLSNNLMIHTRDLETITNIGLLKNEFMVRDPKELQAGAITIPKNTTFNTESEDRTFSIAEVLDALNKDEKADPGLTSYIASINELVVNEKEQLKIKDKSMIANDGVSYLASQEDGLVKGLFDESDSIVGFSPSVESYDITVPASDDADDKKEIKKEDKIIKNESTEPGQEIITDYNVKKELKTPSITNVDKLKSAIFDKKNIEKTKFGYSIKEGSPLEIYRIANKGGWDNSGINKKLNRLIKYYYSHLEQKSWKSAQSIATKILELIDNNSDNLTFREKYSEDMYIGDKRGLFKTPTILK